MRSSFEDEDDPALISKKLWALVKSTSCTSRIPEVVNYKGKFRNNSSDQAELFNEFFCDQFSEPSHYDINIEYSSNNDESFELSFNHNKIANLLKNMNARKAQGPDGIHGHILKNCAFSYHTPCRLYTKPRTTLVSCQMNGRRPMLSLSIKRVLRPSLKITGQYH